MSERKRRGRSAHYTNARLVLGGVEFKGAVSVDFGRGASVDLGPMVVRRPVSVTLTSEAGPASARLLESLRALAPCAKPVEALREVADLWARASGLPAGWRVATFPSGDGYRAHLFAFGLGMYPDVERTLATGDACPTRDAARLALARSLIVGATRTRFAFTRRCIGVSGFYSPDACAPVLMECDGGRSDS